jgi:hypothetical protein
VFHSSGCDAPPASTKQLAILLMGMTVQGIAGACFRPTIQDAAVKCGVGDHCPEGLKCVIWRGQRSCCHDENCGEAAVEGEVCNIALARGRGSLVCTNLNGGPNTWHRSCSPGSSECLAGWSCTRIPGSSDLGACRSLHEGDCDYTNPSTCGDGKACYVECATNSIGATSCKMAGTMGLGVACQRAEDCAPGHGCLGYTCASESRALCARYCRSEADCPAGSVCRTFLCEGSATQFGTCSDLCDPTSPSGLSCPTGLECRLLARDVTMCTCATEIGEREGATCDALHACGSGLVCANFGSGGHCSTICRLSDGKGCAPGIPCSALPDHAIYGACTISPPEYRCNLVPQLGCNAGDGCYLGCAMRQPDAGTLDALDAPGDTQPAPTTQVGDVFCQRAGEQQLQDQCTFQADCATGLDCVTTVCADGIMRGRCFRRCRTSLDCYSNSESLEDFGVAGCLHSYCGSAQTPFSFCSIPCDPTGNAENGCSDGLNCFLCVDGACGDTAGRVSGDVTSCTCRSKSDVGMDGDFCSDTLRCGPGNVCVKLGNQGKCRPVCRFGAPSACPAGHFCATLPNLRKFGACLPD